MTLFEDTSWCCHVEGLHTGFTGWHFLEALASDKGAQGDHFLFYPLSARQPLLISSLCMWICSVDTRILCHSSGFANTLEGLLAGWSDPVDVPCKVCWSSTASAVLSELLGNLALICKRAVSLMHQAIREHFLLCLRERGGASGDYNVQE